MGLYKLKKLVPEFIKDKVKQKQREKQQDYIKSLPEIDEPEFESILRDNLLLKDGDVVFIHGSVDQLNLNFPFFRVLFLLRKVIGENGTMLFPTYPPVNSYEFLKSGNTFDIKKTPSYTGILSEFARKQRNSKRSLHPTKSVCAIGPLAEELTSEHSKSPYPYDSNSPYQKIFKYNAIIVGLGVKTTYLSCVHTVDDFLRETFPVRPYHDQLFRVKCIDYNKNVNYVETYTHDMSKMNFDLPKFFKTYIPDAICEDIDYKGMNFFRADGKKMFDYMVNLAKEKNISIYSKY